MFILKSPDCELHLYIFNFRRLLYTFLKLSALVCSFLPRFNQNGLHFETRIWGHFRGQIRKVKQTGNGKPTSQSGSYQSLLAFVVVYLKAKSTLIREPRPI